MPLRWRWLWSVVELSGKWKTALLRNCCLSATLSTTYLTCSGPESNPDHRNKKPRRRKWIWKMLQGLDHRAQQTDAVSIVRILSMYSFTSWRVWVTIFVSWKRSATQQLGSYWGEFYETWNLRIFRISVEKIQVSFKSEKCNGHLTRRPTYIFKNISLNYF